MDWIDCKLYGSICVPLMGGDRGPWPLFSGGIGDPIPGVDGTDCLLRVHSETTTNFSGTWDKFGKHTPERLIDLEVMGVCGRGDFQQGGQLLTDLADKLDLTLTLDGAPILTDWWQRNPTRRLRFQHPLVISKHTRIEASVSVSKDSVQELPLIALERGHTGLLVIVILTGLIPMVRT